MHSFSFCHSWLLRRGTKAEAVQGKKISNKPGFLKVAKILVLWWFLMEDVLAALPECVL